jgi:hypothetical protein
MGGQVSRCYSLVTGTIRQLNTEIKRFGCSVLYFNREDRNGQFGPNGPTGQY